MFEAVPERHATERHLVRTFFQGAEDVKSQAPGRSGIQLRSDCVPAARARLSQKYSITAADIEQTPSLPHSRHFYHQRNAALGAELCRDAVARSVVSGVVSLALLRKGVGDAHTTRIALQHIKLAPGDGIRNLVNIRRQSVEAHRALLVVACGQRHKPDYLRSGCDLLENPDA